MKSTFNQFIEGFPAYLERIKEMNFQNINSVGNELPMAGIYVLYENGTPLYVGRTNRMKARLKEHGNLKSSHFSASFAFLIAKKQAATNDVDCNRSRKILQNCPEFNFLAAKKRVSDMQFRCIGIDSAIEQTLFEVYAAIELQTLYNDFESH